MRTIAAAAIATFALGVRIQVAVDDAGDSGIATMDSLDSLSVENYDMTPAQNQVNDSVNVRQAAELALLDQKISEGVPFTDDDFKPEVSSLYTGDCTTCEGNKALYDSL